MGFGSDQRGNLGKNLFMGVVKGLEKNWGGLVESENLGFSVSKDFSFAKA